jgi:hypothetical protein
VLAHGLCADALNAAANFDCFRCSILGNVASHVTRCKGEVCDSNGCNSSERAKKRVNIFYTKISFGSVRASGFDVRELSGICGDESAREHGKNETRLYSAPAQKQQLSARVLKTRQEKTL